LSFVFAKRTSRIFACLIQHYDKTLSCPYCQRCANNMFNEYTILIQLGKIPYATNYNFQPWTSISKTSTLKDSLHFPYNLLMSLLKSGAIKRVPIYPSFDHKQLPRHETFYTTQKLDGNNKIPQTLILNYDGEMAYSMIMHQSGLMDILLAFINLYPDYIIEIDCNKEFPYKKPMTDRQGRNYFVNRKYYPDAVIKMISPEQKEYDFIIEFERTKTNEQIRKEKFAVCNNLERFGTYGLSRHTKFLFFYTYDTYNVFTRPLEYGNVKIQHTSIENRLNTLIKDSQKTYLNDTYRFLPFHDFYRLNQGIWLNSRREKVALVY